MEIRKLQYFESVARLSNFTKAAEELHVAQPTITTAIKRMEEELGLALFVRDKRRVMLTVEGEIFLEKVRDILEKIDRAVLDMQELSDNLDCMINIGIVPISGALITPLIFNGFSEEYPNVKYKLLELGSYGIMDALEAGTMDLGYLIWRNELAERYEFRKIYRTEMKVLLHKDNPLSQKERISIKDLEDQKIVIFPQHSYIRQKMDQEFQSWGITPNILIELTQMITVYNLVQNNAGISFAVGDAYTKMIDTENVVAIPLENPIYCDAGFVWKKGKKLNWAARRCVEYVQNHFAV